MTDDIEELGGKVLLNTPVEKLEIEDGRVTKVVAGGKEYESNYVISLAAAAQHGRHGRRRTPSRRSSPRPRACATATSSPCRWCCDGEDLFPDNWIYIHEPDVEVGRIQNFRSWSPWMVPDPDQGLRGPRVLLLRRRRAVGDGRREAGRARHARARAARPGQAGHARVRLRHPRAQGLPDVRHGLRRARSPRSGAGSTGSRTCSRSGATGCTATTTRTTPCSPPCARWTTS